MREVSERLFWNISFNAPGFRFRSLRLTDVNMDAWSREYCVDRGFQFERAEATQPDGELDGFETLMMIFIDGEEVG